MTRTAPSVNVDGYLRCAYCRRVIEQTCASRRYCNNRCAARYKAGTPLSKPVRRVVTR